MAKRGEIADLSAMASPGTEIATRVTPRASRSAVHADASGIRVLVTAVPEDGAANDAVRRLLADALGIAPSRLTLVRGAASRNKVFRVA
jgi:uncharacterized protein